MKKSLGVDKTFLALVIFLAIFGFAIFISASLGIYAKDGSQFSSIAFRQAFFGIILGFISCFIFSKINYKIYKKYALLIFCISIILALLVFVPWLGLKVNGAKRWVSILGLSFQPVAFLNIGFLIYWSAWLAYAKDKISKIRYGLLPYMIITGIMGTILLLQPDTDSFLILAGTGAMLFIVAGGKFKHMIFLMLIGVVGLVLISFSRPYIMSRIKTFFDPSLNPQTSGYQIQQSFIAIGSGQMFGKGLGQSIQKYKFLPESVSDSIYAIVGEELGFIGCIFTIFLFMFLLFRGFRVSMRAPDNFSGLLTSGIVILITLQSFINMASSLGVIPYSGIPLAFFSQGGTAMLTILIMVGIVLNISKYSKE